MEYEWAGSPEHANRVKDWTGFGMATLRIRNVIPKDGRHWAVAAYGKELYHEGSTRIEKELILLPLKEGRENSDSAAWTFADLAGSANARTVTIPIGLILEFQWGSVWLGDEQVGRIQLQPMKIDVDYRPENLKFVNASRSRLDQNAPRYLIPLHPFPLALLAKDSKLLAIGEGRNPYRFLVPSTVSNAFYYCGSSELTQAVHSPGIGQRNNPVWDEGLSYFSRNKVPHIYLADGIHFEDRRIVAAMFSKYGTSQARRLFESTLIDPQGYAAAFPPFPGRDTLTVEGLEIKADKYPRFLVLRILSGKLPVVYPKVVITNREFAKVRTVGIEDETFEPIDREIYSSEQSSVTEVTIDSRGLSTGASHTTVKRMGLDRFTNRVIVERAEYVNEVPVRPLKLVVNNDSLPQGTSRLVDGTVGPANPSIGNTETTVSVVPEDHTALDKLIKAVPASKPNRTKADFVLLLNQLNYFAGETGARISIRGLSADNRDESLGVNLFPIEHKGTENPKAYLYQRTSERRQLLVVDVIYRSARFVLLEAQQKPSECFKIAVLFNVKPETGISVNAIEDIADLAARNNYVWQQSEDPSIRVAGLKHLWEGDDQFLKLFTSFLDQLKAKKA